MATSGAGAPRGIWGRVLAGHALTGAWLCVALGACADPSPAPDRRENRVALAAIVSEPAAGGSLTAARSAVVAALETGLGDSVAYVSLPPNTVPGAVRATVWSAGDARQHMPARDVPTADGGFDPVAVFARAGDTVRVDVERADHSVVRARFAVPPRRPPKVVRTQPPKGRADVPLNARLVVVFSEPVDAASAADGIRLTRNGDAVPATVSVPGGVGLVAELAPDAPLAPNADYQLAVTAGVRDLSGDRLAGEVRVPFRTGDGPSAPTAIAVDPDPVTVGIGRVVTLTAIGYDASGNRVGGFPLTWASADQSVATVSATGVVTGVASGTTRVNACSGTVCDPATVTVINAVVEPTVGVRVTNLTTLTGGVMRVALAINNRGEVLGQGANGVTIGSDPSGAVTVFWDGTSVVQIPDFQGLALNDSGVVAGVRMVGGAPHLATWRAGAGITDLGTLPGATSIYPSAINNRGDIVGMLVVPADDYDWCDASCRPFIWHDGVLAQMVGAPDAYPQDISDDGLILLAMGVVGRWERDVFTLARPRDPGMFIGLAINSTGDLAGYNSSAHPIANRGGSVIELPMLPGDRIGIAEDINNAGWLCGVATASTASPPEGFRLRLWRSDTTVLDLSAALSPPADLAMVGATCRMNDRGQIISNIRGEGGHYTAMMWTVDPPPPAAPARAASGRRRLR